MNSVLRSRSGFRLFPVGIVLTCLGCTGTAFAQLVLTVTSQTTLQIDSSTPYSTPVTVTGGTAPYTWSATGLPAGLSITSPTTSSSTDISGTTTAIGTTTVVVRVADAGGLSATESLFVTVNPLPTITLPATLPNAAVGSFYHTTIPASGGTTPYAYSATGLPAGLSVNPTSGVITGIPSLGANNSSPYKVSVQVTDTNSAQATATSSLTVSPGQLFFSVSTPLPGITEGTPYSTSVGVFGGLAPYAWTATGLPAGIIINGTGSGAATTISGTTTATIGQYIPTVSVSDSSGLSAKATFTVALNPLPSITGPATLPSATVGAPYSTTVTAVLGTVPYSWTATGLPAGLSVNSSTGVISGTPTSGANIGSPYKFSATVTDANSAKATGSYNLTVSPAVGLTISPNGSLPGVTASTPYSTTLTVTGGTAPYSFSASGLPTGLSIGNASTGPSATISGTTTAIGNDTVVVKVSDTSGLSGTATLNVTVYPLPLISPASGALPPAIVGSPYSSGSALSETGGAPSFTFTATPLPSGLTINSTGVITGTPSGNTGSPYSVVVTVTDANSAKATANYSLTVVSPLTIAAPATIPSGTAGSLYTATTVMATGGSGTLSFTATGLPGGLSMSPGGTLSGTPATNSAGPYTVNVIVYDSGDETTSHAYPLIINPPATAAATLSASPVKLSLCVPAATTAAPTPQIVTVLNSSNSPVAVTAQVASSISSYINASPATATVNGTSPATFAISVNPSGLASGAYTADVVITQISSTGSSPSSLTIPLSIVVGPVDSFTPTALSFSHQTGTAAPASQSISITGCGVTGTTTFSLATVTNSGNWLTVSPSNSTVNSTAPGTGTVSVNPTGLSTGTYNALVLALPTGSASSGPPPTGATPITVPVTLTVSSAPAIATDKTSLTFTAQVGSTTPPAEQEVNVNGTVNPAQMTANVTSQTNGLFTITPGGTTIPATVHVSVNPTVFAGLAANTYTGVVTIGTASLGTATIPVTLIVGAPNTPVVSKVTNGASFATATAVSPGEIITLFGTNLGPATPVNLTLTSQGTVSTTLGGTQVMFDNVPAPLTYVSATQINTIVPYEVAGRATTSTSVKYLGATSNAVTLNVTNTAPGIFTAGPGYGQSATLNQDYSGNGPSSPAAKQSFVSIYMTGEGGTSPQQATGSVTPTTAPLPLPLLPVVIYFGGIPLPASAVYYAGEAPGLVSGVLQVTAVIPASAASGAVPVVVTMGANSSVSQVVFVYVQ